KGQSGNPGGRPKIIGEVQELARQYTVEAVDTLASIMRDKKAPAAARAMASNSILDRGYGKPPQMLSATVTARRQVRDMSDAEIMARLEELRAGARCADGSDLPAATD